MKHNIIKSFAAIALGAMLMVACDPDAMFDINDTFPTTPETSDVYNTSWINEKTDTYEDEYGEMHQSVETNIIKFETSTTGTMTYKYVTHYTYSTPNGIITISDEGGTESFNFSYNAGNNTLTIYGSEGYYLVFRRQ